MMRGDVRDWRCSREYSTAFIIGEQMEKRQTRKPALPLLRGLEICKEERFANSPAVLSGKLLRSGAAP